MTTLWMFDHSREELVSIDGPNARRYSKAVVEAAGFKFDLVELRKNLLRADQPAIITLR